MATTPTVEVIERTLSITLTETQAGMLWDLLGDMAGGFDDWSYDLYRALGDSGIRRYDWQTGEEA